MAIDIAKLKKISESTFAQLEKADEKKSYVDERFWKPSFDEQGISRSVIRILPSLKEGKLPWVTQWGYSVHAPRGWYIETSRRTIGEPDPMAEFIAEKWKQAVTDADKDALRKAGLNKARKTHIANILVIKDALHPENDGKVMLYRFGQMVYDMIVNASKPDAFDPDKKGINVTDWDEGANLKLNLYMKDKFPKYDKVSFDSVSAIGNDKRILEIAEKMYDLDEFTGEGAVKPYDELKARVEYLFGNAQKDKAKFETPTPKVVETKSAEKSKVTREFTADEIDTDVDDFDYDKLINDL